MIKRPGKLRLLGKTWRVAYGEVGGEDIGECDLERQTLTVKDGLKLEQEKSTLLHECLHAISESLGLGLTEKQVLGLEAGLYDLNNSNPRIFSYLRKQRGSKTS